MRVIFITLFTLYSLSCNQSKLKNDKSLFSKEQSVNAGNAKINGEFEIKLNGHFWRGNLFYSFKRLGFPDSNQAIYYLDSVTTNETNSATLQKIFMNEDEEYFHFPNSHISDRKVDKKIDFSSLWVKTGYNGHGRIIVEDINFDGFPDLLLHNDLLGGATNRYYDIWVYSKEKNDYLFWSYSQKLGLWAVDKNNHTLTLGHKLGGGIFNSETWKMSGKDTSGILVVKEKGYSINNQANIKREELENGKWVKTYDGYLNLYFEWKSKTKGY